MDQKKRKIDNLKIIAKMDKLRKRGKLTKKKENFTKFLKIEKKIFLKKAENGQKRKKN